MTDERSGGPVRETEVEEMARYGITRIPVDNFYYREFHYTNLKDAVAQATRDEAQSSRRLIAGGAPSPAV